MDVTTRQCKRNYLQSSELQTQQGKGIVYPSFFFKRYWFIHNDVPGEKDKTKKNEAEYFTRLPDRYNPSLNSVLKVWQCT